MLLSWLFVGSPWHPDLVCEGAFRSLLVGEKLHIHIYLYAYMVHTSFFMFMKKMTLEQGLEDKTSDLQNWDESVEEEKVGREDR